MELETVNSERSERNVRKEKTKKITMVTMAILSPDDRDTNKRTTSSRTHVVAIGPNQTRPTVKIAK